MMTTDSASLQKALALTPRQAAAALGAACALAATGGDAPGPRTTALLEVLAASLGRPATIAIDESAFAPDLGEVFPTEAARRALVDALIIVVCIEGEVHPARRLALEELAVRLGVRSPFLALLDAFARRRLLTIKRALATRSPDARRIFSRIWSEEGVLGVLRAVVFVLGLHRDAKLAARFRALATLPAGSFGRAVIDHFEARQLAFPGERGGVPERMAHHDLMHVLNGYDTDAAGECAIAGFYAGFTGEDGFTFIMTALATFHLGLRVSPAVVRTERGAFDPARVLAAYLQGRRLAVDVMGPWDYWAMMPLPIEEARARLGLAASTAITRSP